MLNKSIGFIGGGRLTQTILEALQQGDRLPPDTFVSDVDPAVLADLKKKFPHLHTALNDNQLPAKQEIVIAALPNLRDILAEIKRHLSPSVLFISLAPKLTIAELSFELGDLHRIARAISDPTVHDGFIPMVFSKHLDRYERAEIVAVFCPLGKCVEVPEEELEELHEKLKAA